jgi:hypothetical protein
LQCLGGNVGPVGPGHRPPVKEEALEKLPILQRFKQWARQHEAEIRANWRRMKVGKPLETIEPLR